MDSNAHDAERVTGVEFDDSATARGLVRPGSARRRWSAVWGALSGTIGAIMGLLPHVLHHVGFLLGAGLFAGAVGSVIFGVLGLLLSIPLLTRLYRRYGTWEAPAIGVAVFTTMFALSAFVIGPRISGSSVDPETPAPSPSSSITDHDGHHSSP